MATIFDKINRLENARVEKINKLSGNVVVGGYDADSLVFESGATGRLTNQGWYPQAPELKDTEGNLTQEGMKARIISDQYLLGIDNSSLLQKQITPEEYYTYNNEANKKIKEAFAAKNLNLIPQAGKEKYGRSLYDVQAVNNDKTFSQYVLDNTKASGVVNNPMEVLRSYAKNPVVSGYSPKTNSERVGNAVKAFPAGMANLSIGTADWAVEGVGKILGQNWDIATDDEKVKIANRFAGYNDIYSKHNIDQISKDYDQVTKDVELTVPSTWANLVKEDNPSKIWNMVSTALATPETAIYSLGYMLPALIDPSKKTKIGSKVLSVLANESIDEAAKKLAIKTIKKESSAKELVSYLGAKNAGAALVAADQTNNQMDEFIVNNKGVEPDMLDIGRAFTINFLGMKLEAGVTKDVINPNNLSDIIKKLSETELQTFIARSANTVGKLAKAGMMEAAQEYTQTLGEAFNKIYGTDKAKDMTALDTVISPDVLKEATVGGIMGAAGGVHMALPGQSPEILKQSYKAVSKPVNSVLTKLAEVSADRTAEDVLVKKAGREQATSDLEKEVVSRRIEITEDMTEEQKDNATTINSNLEDLFNLDVTDDTFKEELQTNLNAIDSMKKDMGFSTTKPTEEANIVTEPIIDKPITPKGESKVEYDSPRTEESIRNAGLVNILTKSDKIKEIKVEAMKGDTRVSDASAKKSKLSSTFNADDNVIQSVIEGKMDETVAASLTKSTDNNIVNFAKRLGKKLSPVNDKIFSALQNINEKVSKTIIENTDAKKSMELLFGEKSSSQRALKVASMVLDTVHSAMRSEYDINKKYKIKNDKVAEARRQDVAHQLGKELVNSYELRLAGKPEETAKAYIEVGEQMLTIAEKAGLVQFGLNDVAIHNIHDMEGKRLSTEEAKKYYHSSKKGTVQVPTVKITGIKDTSRGSITSEVLAANALSSLFKPINYELPTKDSVEEVPSESKLSPAHEKIISDYNSMVYSVKPEALQVLREVKDYILSKYPKRLKDGTVIGDTDKALSSDTILIRLLGLQKSNAKIRTNTEGGKAIGRKSTITNLLDNLEFIEEGGLHFNYESAINQRIHVMQTILDFQGDKYMARQILQGGSSPKKVSGMARQLLLNTVAEELGWTVKEVENVIDKTMIGAMDYLDANGSIGISDLPKVANKLGISSPFKALSLIKVMSDIRKSDGISVTTSYQVESDATASGVVNTLLNLSGIPKVQKILEILGIGTNNKGIDPYNFIASILEKSPLYSSHLEPILNKLKDVGLDARKVAKYPIMKWFYGQLDSNNNADMGESIAEDLIDMALYNYNQKSMDLINEILGSKKYVIDSQDRSKETPISEITEEDQNTIAKYYMDNLASEYTDALNMEFAEVAGYRYKMGEIYKMLRGTKKWKGTLRTAMDALLPSNKLYKMSVQKLKQAVFKEDGTTYTTNKMMDNETSFNVNLQHATDAALLLMSIKDILGDVVDSGVMTVHDALYSDAETALKIMDRYNYYTKEAAINYDYMDIALKELNDAIKEMEAGPLKDKYKSNYEAMKKENDILIAEKKKYLQDKELNILGDWEVGNELAKERLSKKDTTETREKVTLEVKNTEVYTDIKSVLRSITMLAGNGISGADINQLVKLLQKLPVSETHTALLTKVVEAFSNKDNRIKLITDVKANTIDGKRYPKEGIGWSGYANVVTIPGKVSMTIKDAKTGYTVDLNNADTLVEVFAHEIDHAIQYQYIHQNLNKSNELKYLSRVIESLKNKELLNISSDAKSRLEYALDPKFDTARQISEFSSIVMNELSVRNEILGLLESKSTIDKVIAIVEKVIQSVQKFFAELSNDKLTKLPINVEMTITALKELDTNARSTILSTNTEITPAQMMNKEDTNKDISLNPITAVNDAVAKTNRFASDWMIIFADVLDEALSPKLMKSHMKLKHVSPIYKEVVSLLRTGFYDSEFAQKMHYIIGLAGDVTDKVIKTSLSLFSAYQQESAKEREFMAEMDRQINDTYSKKDRITVHQLFSDTGIANLISIPEIKIALFNGTKTIAQLIEEVKATIDPNKLKALDEVANEWVNGNSKTNAINVMYAKVNSDGAYVYTTLKAISMIDNGEKLLVNMNKDLRDWMMSIALANRDLNNEINEMADDYEGNNFSKDKQYNSMYDGSYSMDIHDKVYEYRILNSIEMRNSTYTKENGWIVLRNADNNIKGLVARESLAGGRVAGIGLGANRYTNGAFLSLEQSQEIMKEVQALDESKREAWLSNNKLVQDGNRFRVLLDKKTKIEKLGLVQNAAHSLYRTYIHNKELIQSESIRKLMLENGTEYIKDSIAMRKLEQTLKDNDRKGVRGKLGFRTEVKPFVNIDYTSSDLSHIKSFEDLKKEYPMIAKYFKTPEGLTSFNGFNRKVSLVKRGVSDVILGHKNFSIFGNSDYRELAKIENMFKKIVILAKQKMIVTNPIKLLNDSITNIGILSMMDIGIIEIGQGLSKGLSAYKEYANERSKYVTLAMESRLADAMFKMDSTDENKKKASVALNRKNAQLNKLERLEFHDAFNYGFVQSYSTDLVIKEFDTITGIQQDIDTFIDKYTHDRKGDPNKLFNAIKWWQRVGFGMDDVFRKMGEVAKVKGTDVGTELVELADRLKNKKNDKESVARYLSDYMGSPASEVVNYGSAYMVLADALSKYVLAKHLMTQVNPRVGDRQHRRRYTKEEAYSIANDTFVDYRTNLPAPIKALSDYGILMFPNFWIKIQRTIASLIKYHPVSSSVSYAVESAMGAESLNIGNQALPRKILDGEGVSNPSDHISLASLILVAG
ncbi:MAG: hypothetical protein WC179_05195 [Candidatus Cloacimonadaceae bacterium]